MIRDIIFFDTETTGIKTSTAKLLEIFLMRCRGEKLMPVSYLHLMCNPEMKIPKGAQEVNGIKQSWVDLADPQEPVLKQVQNFIGPKDILSGHNLRKYDMEIVSKYGISYENEIHDTLEMAREAGFKKCKQGQLCEHFGIDTGTAHRAKDDVMALRQLYIHLSNVTDGNKLPL